MALSVLITQCLQRDFVGPIGAHEPLPNRLHVGREEARRLLGAKPETGPVAQLVSWARSRPSAELELLHVRDWHDRDDPAQRDHLATFGEHCLAGTPGAALVLGLERGPAERPNERFVDAVGLSDFEDTLLPRILGELARRSGGPLRVAVVGVWTEAKVSFLLYDLKTRGRIEELATCSALTASASRAQHFNALEQLQRILGVRVFDSVGELASWLAPGSEAPRTMAPAPGFGPRLAVEGDDGTLAAEDRAILGVLYRESADVVLAPLSGGFSGARVYRVRSKDALGHEQAPSVAKLGPRSLVGKERVAFEKVEAILGNHAPAVRGFVDIGERAGIQYSYAAMGAGPVRTLQSLFATDAPEAELVRVIGTVFDEILAPFHAAAQLERLPLLEHYAFSAKLAPSVREKVTALVGAGAAKDRLCFPGGFEAANVCGFYESFLASPLAESTAGEYRYVSFVHGDLNGANVLVDGRDNVWVIDFFHTARAHVLKDLAKLENDLQYLFTPLAGEAELVEALAITAALREVEDLARDLPEAPPSGVRSARLVRAWRLLRLLRGVGARLVREDRDPEQLAVALLRYAAHTLSFDEAAPLQRHWALAAACGHAEDLESALRRSVRLRVDWLGGGRLPGPGRLGITLCPGRRDRGRLLDADVAALREQGATRVVCLATDPELDWAGVPGLRGAVEGAGLRFDHHPIPDQGVPSPAEAARLAAELRAALRAGENIVLHCLGGLGRSGLVAACTLVAEGAGAEEALAEVRRCRGPRAVETAAQEAFVRSFRP